MSAQAIISVDEFLRMKDSKRFEYVDGLLIKKSVATIKHNFVRMAIIHLILQRFPAFGACPDLHVRLRTTEYRLPDVSIGLIDVLREEDYPSTPLYLAVELLSPGDRLGETFAKCERYHDWGAPYCWVIDPEKQRCWEYAKGGEPIEVHERLTAGEIEAEFREIFKYLS